MQLMRGYIHCRSELAREKLKSIVFSQTSLVIVDLFREQARSYKGQKVP